MSAPAIQVEGLWKQYTVGAMQDAPGTFYDLLSGALKAPFGRLRRHTRPSNAPNQFWALRDLNFEIQPGEVFGVVGRNGAGKSTLLKILSRITAPTRGRITIRGTIASLLEVGTGFHPELTGRENIYLNATILGMNRREIDRKLDAIVAFSGVETFLDTPVKRYSSGMYVRLAFAVAAHVDADILLIDEVLAVGDAEFQKRCLGMMGDVARAGRTVIFVSHNLTALRNLCSTGLLMDKGQISELGLLPRVLESYAEKPLSASEVTFTADAAETQESHVTRVAVIPAGGATGGIYGTRGMSVQVDVQVIQEDRIDVFLHCYNDSQVMVFSSGSFFDASVGDLPVTRGEYRFFCDIPGRLLNDGTYTLDVMLVRDRQHVLSQASSVISFSVLDDFEQARGWHWRPAGTVRPPIAWRREHS